MGQHIVLTGATGNTGQVIAQECKRRGLPFVAMVRSEASRAKLAAAGIETVAGDFDDPPSLERALEGAEKVYLVYVFLFKISHTGDLLTYWKSEYLIHGGFPFQSIHSEFVEPHDCLEHLELFGH